MKTTWCSVTGTGHHKAGKPCEDAVFYAVSPKAAAIAVCDGAGSARLAAEGAAICSKSAAEFSAAYFEELYQADAAEREAMLLDTVRMALSEEADRRSANICDLACTLMLAVRAPDGRAVILQIGDGLIFGQDNTGTATLLSRYEHTFMNLTSFVTSSDTRCMTKRYRNTSAFLLMTDGVAENYMLTADAKPRKTVTTLLELAYLLPQQLAEQEMKSFAAFLQSRHVRDDISIAVMADPARTDAVLCELKETMHTKLFGLPARNSKRLRNKDLTLLRGLYKAGGMTAQEAAAKLHLHDSRFAKRYLQRMCERGIVCCENGRYSVPD